MSLTKRRQLPLGKRNQVTLPRDFVPEGTTQFECKISKNGEIVLTPCKSIPVSQAYFWTNRWQAGEREASEDIKAGRVKRFRNVKELIAEMDRDRE